MITRKGRSWAEGSTSPDFYLCGCGRTLRAGVEGAAKEIRFAMLAVFQGARAVPI